MNELSDISVLIGKEGKGRKGRGRRKREGRGGERTGREGKGGDPQYFIAPPVPVF